MVCITKLRRFIILSEEGQKHVSRLFVPRRLGDGTEVEKPGGWLRHHVASVFRVEGPGRLDKVPEFDDWCRADSSPAKSLRCFLADQHGNKVGPEGGRLSRDDHAYNSFLIYPSAGHIAQAWYEGIDSGSPPETDANESATSSGDDDSTFA